MGEAMKGVTKAMGQMNRQMNLPALQKIMQEFEMQNEKMEMVSEVMGDAIDDALEGDEEEEETEELVNQVLDEIGINVNNEVFYHAFVIPIFDDMIRLQCSLIIYGPCINGSLSMLLLPRWLLQQRKARLHRLRQLTMMMAG